MDDWREMYRLHAKLPAYHRKVKESILMIQNALAETPGTWALSFSGGKDSTVMLDLCYRAGWRGPILFQTYGKLETLPDNIRMAKWASDYYGLELHTKEVSGEFDVYRDMGYFFIEAITPEEQAAVRRWYRQAFGELSKYARKQGWAGQFLGLRIEESEQRRMVLGHRKGIYYAKSRKLWTCCPVYRWNGRDIWAYLVANNLPWAKIYNAPGEDRERIRNDVVFLAGSGSIRHGQFVFWKRYYPELFTKLASEWPEIRRYV